MPFEGRYSLSPEDIDCPLPETLPLSDRSWTALTKMSKSEPYPSAAASGVDFKESTVSNTALDDGSSTSSIANGYQKTFLSEGLEDSYVPIDSYEGRHRYDPHFRWEAAEEKKLVRKVGFTDGPLRSTSELTPIPDRLPHLCLGLLDLLRAAVSSISISSTSH